MAILTSKRQKVVAGRLAKLKNRRVHLLKREDGSWVVITKLLISRKERFVYRQEISLTDEAMHAVAALWMAMVELKD